MVAQEEISAVDLRQPIQNLLRGSILQTPTHGEHVAALDCG
jgi:hypothetical protein